MKYIAWFLVFLNSTASATLPAVGAIGAIKDARYCGEPARDKNGKINRSQTVLRRFAKVFPCPATLEPVTSCDGWAIDHTIPLAEGGCDSIANLTWLPDEIKSCSSTTCKDRWERKYHAVPREAVVK